MNIEIKYRAICTHSGDYVYGNFIHSKRFKGCGNEFRIYNQETGLESDIDIKTLGQFKGLQDINGIDLYDGDIVKWGHCEYSKEFFERYAVVKSNPDIQFHIIYFKNSKTKVKKEANGHFFHFGSFAYKDTQNHLEIIGNIHENPEILK